MDTTQGIADLPIAVIGMACRLPGAGNLEQFWELLVGGRSSVGEVPADRFDQELYYDPRQGIPAKSYTKIGALLDSREFDRARCPLPEKLVGSADPTHLLMCEVAAAACRHAGLDPFNLPENVRNAGVYVGHAQGSTLAGDYIYHTCVEEAAQLLPDLKELGELPAGDRMALADELVSRVREGLPSRSPDSPDVSTHMVAGLVSRAFRLSGPYLALNAACASSPQALLLAVRALQLGRIEMAIVGGASDCKSDTLTLFSAAQSMSASGSRPFDAEADGLVCGEGYVALVLKTLQRALADGDPVQAVIRSLGISSDGHGKSLWAPRKEGQIEAMKRAYRGGLDPSSLQYIEAHATSTSLGDATELTALGEVLSSRVPASQKVALGSVKANIGHTLECAGLASVCKTILCMQKGTIPAAINIRELNKKIDWQKAPFYVPTQPTAWPEPAGGQPRRAAVNSFGIGGLNMHIVLEAFSKAVHRREERPQPAPRFRTADGEAIAVIGMGCILPGAEGIDKYWQLLESGREAIVDAPPDRWLQTSVTRRLATKRGGFITDFQYDWRRHKVPPKQVAQADPMQFMLLEAADQALKHAGYDKRPFHKKMAGVLVGTEFGGDFSTQLTLGLRLPHMQKLLGELLSHRGMDEAAVEQAKEAFCKALLARWPALVDETGSFSTSTLASRITKTLDLMGGAAAIDSGDTSAMSALAGSIDLLLAGDCDVMFCAAGQRRMAPATYEALAMAGVLNQRDELTSPLDAGANGFVPGEAVGVVLLKRLADARRDGDPIHAIIRGIGAARADSCQQALELAAQRSLAFAGSSPEELALLEVDGHGLSEEDRQIVAAARQLSGQNRSTPLVLGTAVGQLGHTGGASGMISLFKANLEIEKGMAPAIVGLHNPLSEAADASLLAPREPIALRPVASAGRRLAGVASQGKGLAFHVVVQRSERVPAEQVTTSFQPAAGSRAASASPPTVTTAPMSLSSSKAIQIAPNHGARPLPRQRPRVAFVFPGQGSQYAGMLQELVAASPASRAVMEELDAAMRRAGEPTFAELAWGDARGLGRDIWQTQIAMLLADMIVHAALQERGIAPDVVAGHSFGEIAALTAAGAWDLDTAIQIVKARAAGVASGGSRGGLLATSAPRERIEELGGLQGLAVYGANHNAADQTVVGGMRESLESFAAVLKQHGFSSQMLAVPAAFHTPLMLGASGPLESALHAAAVWPPQAPLLSSITVRYEADPQSIRENLARQLTRPVEWVALIRRLASEGPVVLVEVGPQQVLTKLSRRILQDRQIAGIVATDDPKQPGLQQLDRVQELLESVGAMDRGRSRIARLAAPSGPQQRGKIVHFDATEVRREKMRQAAKQETEPAAVPQSPMPAAVAPMPAVPVAAENRIAAALPAETAKDNGHASAVVAATRSNGAPPAVDPAQLESFLINFVVEQTGYPPDVVDLDADLEADLGIDSIKKAQMFGELQEYFPDVVQPREDLTLDDFPTLRHVLHFLRGEMEQPAPQPPEPVVAALELSPTTEATASLPAPVPSSIESAPAKHSAIDPAQLESFLVNFVVEQTGYPPDVVDVDADLEADLGIDSIKKAQMFGELQEYFPDVVQPREDLTLDDFPTLRHVLNFLRGEMPAEAARVTEPTTVPPESPPVAEEAWDAASEPIAQPQPVAAVRASAPLPRIDPTQLEAFLVNFVVEQTGYPADVVDLDADLEADLGIDSIKKAQMFGELQEYFPDVVQPREDVTLDDFPTLRHVLDFLRGELPAKPTAAVAASTNQRHAASGNVPDEESPAELAALTLRLSGSPYEMGLAHGRELQSQIRQVLRYYADLADETLDELPLAELRSDPGQLFSAEELEEMRGIAEGAGVPQGNIIAHNLALLADLGVSTTQLVVPGNQSTATMHALEEPLPLVAGLREELLPVVQVRQRVDSVPHAVCSFAGLVFGLSGINAAGLAVSSGSLAGQIDIASKRSGRLPALLVGELLASAADIDAAVEIARQFESRTAWNACITDSTSGRVIYLEYDGTSLDVRQPAEAIVAVSANDNGSIASADRLRKLSDMLDSSPELSSAASVRQALARCGASRENGFSHGGLALEASHAEDPVLHVIMQPSDRQLWLGGIGPANGSLLGVRLEELGDRGAAVPLAEEATLKKKDLSRTRPR